MSIKTIVPVKVSLTEGDYYTLWAPSWNEGGAEWQAFLGDDENIFFFTSPAHLLTFIESGARHDLDRHPKWAQFQEGDASRVIPSERDGYRDIIGAPALLAEDPSYDTVRDVSGIFQVARSLGEVGGSDKVTVFFASHSILANVHRGFNHFSSPQGRQEWTGIGNVVLGNWAEVVEALDDLVHLPEVDEDKAAEAGLRIDAALVAAQEREEARREEEEQKAQDADPYDTTAWAAAGIDPLRIVIDGRTLYTLRTYLGRSPVFLGKHGEIFTFGSSRTLVTWMTNNNDHDLAGVSTWEDLLVSANGGELKVEVHPDNEYSFTGITKDIESGVDAVDTAQMSRAYELMADAADYAADDSMNSFFLAHPQMQDYISYMLGSSESTGYVPVAPFAEQAKDWSELEEMLQRRFSRS